MVTSFHQLLLLLLIGIPSLPPSMSIGINYGQVANNLPDPSAVLPLLHSIGITKVKLYDTNPSVLRAFANTSIEFIVGLPDQCLTGVANDPSEALAWVKYNILPYFPSTNITAITVGNEVLTGKDVSNIRHLLPAMESIHAALVSVNLDRQISITTPHSLAILSTSYPPSSATFRPEITPYLSKIISFLAKTGSPFLINAYPYFAYKSDPAGVKLDYVLCEDAPDSGVVDVNTGLKYDNMLFAQVDAVRASIEAAVGKEKGRDVEVRVSETGWPSKGDENESGATAENARKYNGNLFLMEVEKRGTPMRPDLVLEIYVFALFNENMKPGPTSERNYGLFEPDGTPTYDLGLKSEVNSTGRQSSGGDGGGDGVESSTHDPTAMASVGSLVISSSKQKVMHTAYFGCDGACHVLDQVVLYVVVVICSSVWISYGL